MLHDDLNEKNDLQMSEAKQAQKTTAPYGTWASPVTTDVILQSVRLISCRDDGLLMLAMFSGGKEVRALRGSHYLGDILDRGKTC